MISKVNRSTPLQKWGVLIGISLCFLGCKAEDPGTNTTPIENSVNIFAASQNWYVNPIWSEQASAHNGSAIAHHNTAIWINKIADVETISPGEVENIPGVEDGDSPSHGLGLRDHLEGAETQQNALVHIVLHGAPGRDCAAISSGGELPASDYGFAIYKEHFIDRIANIIDDYPHIPIAITLEPYTLTDLVRNHRDSPCIEVSNSKSWGYTNIIRYAINTLSRFQNVHLYLDIGSASEFGRNAEMTLTTLFFHGVLTGFDEALRQDVATYSNDLETAIGDPTFYSDIADVFIEPPPPIEGDTSPPSLFSIHGFASNIADYVPLDEPYLGNPLLPDNDTPLMSAYFYDWNPHVDEKTFTQYWLNQFRTRNIRDTGHLGVIIDTGRNGWGQAHSRLQGSIPTTDPNEVDYFRIDQREHRSNWCNQPSGLGQRPQANPPNAAWVDAYVWIKPPGESDGLSDPNSPLNPNEYKKGGWDPSCDPNQLSTDGQSSETTEHLSLRTGALPDSPPLNDWFADGFTMYLENAWPPICEGLNDRCPAEDDQ